MESARKLDFLGQPVCNFFCFFFFCILLLFFKHFHIGVKAFTKTKKLQQSQTNICIYRFELTNGC